ncbi:MAG: RNA methyltransferase, partial [Spirochaetales bacterium]|nr:RNA methyltransferase [Spirochaetales bacterium]
TVLSGGTTRRRGKWRKYFALDADAFAKKATSLDAGKIAVVFGNEKTGLSDEDLALCNLAVRIPTSDLFPSLNLSHAVQIVTYELFKAASTGSGEKGFKPIDRGQVDNLTETLISTLADIGFFKITDPEDLSIFFRDIFSRASLSAGEAKRLGKVFTKIDGLFKKRDS